MKSFGKPQLVDMGSDPIRQRTYKGLDKRQIYIREWVGTENEQPSMPVHAWIWGRG